VVPYDRDRRDKPLDKPGDDEGEWVELVEIGLSCCSIQPSRGAHVSLRTDSRFADNRLRLANVMVAAADTE
jgi:hypothetical protein